MAATHDLLRAAAGLDAMAGADGAGLDGIGIWDCRNEGHDSEGHNGHDEGVELHVGGCVVCSVMLVGVLDAERVVVRCVVEERLM